MESPLSADDSVRADWFDPHQSRRFDAALRLDADGKTLRAECADGRSVSAPAGEVRVSPRLGNTAQSLQFPDGVTLLVRDSSALERILAASGKHLGSRVQHKAEHNFWLLLLIGCAAIVAVGFLVHKALPAFSEYIAWKVPLTVLDKPADELLAELEGDVLRPSRLDESRQNEVQAVLDEVASDLPWERDYRLLLRRMQFPGYEEGIPNAFAFPNGVILVTDRLVQLAESEDELVGVLVHEIEHMRRRHSIRLVVSSFALVAVMGLITGDFLDLFSLPVLLAEFSYARRHEVEADCLAYDYMKKTGRDIAAIGSLLERMEQELTGPAGEGKEEEAEEAEAEEAEKEKEEAESDEDEQSNHIERWAVKILSTHPLTRARKDPAELCKDYIFEDSL